MKMKQFFDEHEEWTDVAIDIDREAELAVKPIFDKYIALGYSVRGIAYMIGEATRSKAGHMLVLQRIERRKENR
jgi:hypothetical protein